MLAKHLGKNKNKNKNKNNNVRLLSPKQGSSIQIVALKNAVENLAQKCQRSSTADGKGTALVSPGSDKEKMATTPTGLFASHP